MGHNLWRSGSLDFSVMAGITSGEEVCHKGIKRYPNPGFGFSVSEILDFYK